MGTHLDLDDVVAGHPKAMDELAALRAENEQLKLDTTWQDHADHWQQRATKAEARVAELEELLRHTVARAVEGPSGPPTEKEGG